MTDELTYFKASSDIWDFGRLLHPSDVWFSTWGQLAPLLYSPAFAQGSTTTAFDIAHVVNALAFASSAIPVYLLARRVLTWAPLAVLAAALSVCVPWLASSATLLTEPIAYPAFCWSLLLMYRSVAEPSWKNDLLALAGISLAFFGRTQFAALAPAFVAGVVVHEAGWVLVRGEGDRLRALGAAARRHVVLLGACVLGLVVVAAVGKDRIASETLGAYSATAYGSLIPHGTRQVGEELLAIVGIGCGVLPLGLAIGWMGHTFVRPASREQHALASLALTVSLALTTVVGSFVVRFTMGPGLSERYLFYLAPILFIGMLACLTLRRAPIAIAAGGLFAYWIYAGKQLYEAPGSALAPAAPPHTVFNAHLHDVLGTGALPTTAIGAIGLLVVLALAVPRRLIAPRVTALTVGLAVLAFCGWQTWYTLNGIHRASEGAPAGYLASRDWIDDTLPRGAHAGAVLSQIYDVASTPRAWWEALLWNRSLRLSYKDHYDTGQTWSQTKIQELYVDDRTGVVRGLDGERYVVRTTGDHRWVLSGARTLRRFGNFLLQELPAGPRRVPWVLRASDQTGVVAPDHPGVLRLFRDGERPVRLTLNVPPGAKRGGAVRIRDATRVRTVALAPGQTRTITVRAKAPRPGLPPEVRFRGLGPESATGVQVVVA